MRIPALGLASLVLLTTTTYPRVGGACLPLQDNAGPWTLDAAYASDVVPPSAVTATASVARFDDPAEGGCGDQHDFDCGGSGSARIELRLRATDDQVGSDVGYQFLVVGGQPPEGFRVGPGSGPLRPNDPSSSTSIGLRFANDASAFSFDLEIRAVDKNGNAGPPVVLTIDG